MPLKKGLAQQGANVSSTIKRMPFIFKSLFKKEEFYRYNDTNYQ